MENPTIRKLLTLLMIPASRAKGITVAEIVAKLRDEHDFEKANERNIQRDLLKLSEQFSIVHTEGVKPYLWSWVKDKPTDLPLMGSHSAIAFHMVEQHLTPLLSKNSLVQLEHYFVRSKEILERKTEKTNRDWLAKSRVVPRSLQLNQAPVKEGVIEAITQALYEERQLDVEYQSVQAARTGETKKYLIHPYGILYRDSVIELIGRKSTDDKRAIKRWMLHRFIKADMLIEGSTIPPAFNIDEYIKSQLAFPFSGDEIQFKAWFHEYALNNVRETHLGDDQTIEEIEGGAIVTATVRDTNELKQWILGQGERVCVIEPEGLRTEIQEGILATARKYGYVINNKEMMVDEHSY